MKNPIDLDELNKGLKNTLMGNLGIVFTKVSNDCVEATMPVDERTRQSKGFLHGGASIALAESIAGMGSNQRIAHGELCFGIQISASHMASTSAGDSVIAKGKPQHIGRTTHVWDVDVFSTGTGKLLSSIRITNYIVPQKA